MIMNTVVTNEDFHSPTNFSWENGPMEILQLTNTKILGLRPWTRVAVEVVVIHNCLIRALNSIYVQAPHIPLSEYNNFTTYALATYRGLVAHDPSSGNSLFSALERLTGNDRYTQHHAEFDTPLTAWGNWLQSIASKKNNFSPDICRSMMDDFMPALHEHLEIVPWCISLSFNESSEGPHIADMMKEHMERVFGQMSKTKILPVFVLNHDAAFMGEKHEFLGGMALVRWVLREVCAMKYKECWKFSTMGFDGKVREVMFLGKEK
jgi:hypothetical protein